MSKDSKNEKEKEKNVSISILKLRNFSWMNCVLLDFLARLYLNDIAFEANILLLLLLEEPTLTNTVATNCYTKHTIFYIKHILLNAIQNK
jgi:hypothetical protein